MENQNKTKGFQLDRIEFEFLFLHSNVKCNVTTVKWALHGREQPMFSCLRWAIISRFNSIYNYINVGSYFILWRTWWVKLTKACWYGDGASCCRWWTALLQYSWPNSFVLCRPSDRTTSSKARSTSPASVKRRMIILFNSGNCNQVNHVRSSTWIPCLFFCSLNCSMQDFHYQFNPLVSVADMQFRFFPGRQVSHVNI